MKARLNARSDRARTQAGFTLIEILVAISISVLLFGACIALYVRAARFKSRSEERLFMYEDARGVCDRMTRDIQGLFVIDSNLNGTLSLDDYWKPGVIAADKTVSSLTLVTATENRGKRDFRAVSYYLDNGKLYREESDNIATIPSVTPPADSLLVEDIQKLSISTFPEIDTITAGNVPRLVRVTLEFKDPNGVSGYQRFSFDVRPGSEER